MGMIYLVRKKLFQTRKVQNNCIMPCNVHCNPEVG